MILTYKLKHERNFEHELSLAQKVADYGVKNKSISSKDVKHIGLKSAIANQILRKYSRNKKVLKAKSVNLTIPSQSIQIIKGKIYIPCLDLNLNIFFDKNFKKINQIELNQTYAFISVTYKEPKTYKPKVLIGVDRNTTKHTLVASCLETGKVLKLGKECHHIHDKYKEIRRQLGKKGKLKKLKSIKQRERNIIKNINHQITTALVNHAREMKGGLVLEDLKQIRQTAKSRRDNRYSLNSWSYYQQQLMLEYKAKKYGVPIFYVAPQYTSQRCSICGHIESTNRKGNLFQCKKCGKVEDSGVNAGFNIAFLHKNKILQFCKESDLQKGNTDTPKKAILKKSRNFRTPSF